MNPTEIINEADDHFLSFEIDKAQQLYQDVLNLNINDNQRLHVLKYLCKIFENKSDLESFEEYLNQYTNIFKKEINKSSDLETLKRSYEKLKLKKSEEEKPIRIMELIAIGYWKSDEEPHLPHPKEFQDNTLSKNEKELVINHIENARVAISYRGFSWCRFECGEANMGTECLTDGTYIFPEGLTHYIKDHNIRLPEKFISHIKNYKPLEGDFYIEVANIDYTWWRKIKSGKGLFGKIKNRFFK